jgi:hypothetical protein
MLSLENERRRFLCTGAFGTDTMIALARGADAQTLGRNFGTESWMQILTVTGQIRALYSIGYRVLIIGERELKDESAVKLREPLEGFDPLCVFKEAMRF